MKDKQADSVPESLKPQTWPDLDYNKPPRTDYPQQGNTAERLRLSLEETKQQLIQAYHLKDYEFNNRKWLVGLIKSIVDEQKQNNHE